MNNIYLVGFMGTGKSAAGGQLAKRKNWQFVDLDDLIVLREKRSIAEIFAKDKEPYFRKVEKKALKEVARQDNFVVACGGGIIIDKDNIKIMKQTGRLICLCASPKVIFKRLAGDLTRPLLRVADPLERIELLLKLRAPYYMQADTTVDTSRLSVKQVASKLYKLTLEKK